MPDIVDPKVRSRMMSGIRGRDTEPELRVRRELHARGFRFVKNTARLPGRPDVVLTRWKVAVFVHGCFWHWHGCILSKLPDSNRQFWRQKLTGNAERDALKELTLVSMGWRVAIIWECAFRGAQARERFGAAMDGMANWIRKEPDAPAIMISGERGCERL